MGIDARFYIMGNVNATLGDAYTFTDETLWKVKAAAVSIAVDEFRFESMFNWKAHSAYGLDVYADVKNEILLQIDFMQRYFGETYPRGDWPFIKRGLLLACELWPLCKVYYGGDYDTDWTDAKLVEYSLIKQLDSVWEEKGSA